MHVSGSSYTNTVFCSSCHTEIVEAHLAKVGQNLSIKRSPKQMFCSWRVCAKHTSSGQSKSIQAFTQCPSTCTKGGGRVERCPHLLGKGINLVLCFWFQEAARFHRGLSTAVETSTRVGSAGQIGAGKKVKCKEKGKRALIYFLRQMRSFLPSKSQSWSLVFFMFHYKCL